MNTQIEKSDDFPFQSIVLPVRNEERFIATTLGYVQNQDYPRDKVEIIVIDGQSDDATARIVRELQCQDPRIHLLSNPRRLSSAARNIGARAARGEIITFIDGHTYIDNNQLLKNIAELMRSRKVSVLSRPQFLETPENDFFQRAVALARRSAFGHGLDSTIYSSRDIYVNPTSSGASYKKEIFEKVGYFDETFDAAEDVEFNYRNFLNGYQSYTSLRLAVYYYPRQDLRSLFHQMKRYGIGRFRLAKKHREAISSGSLMPALFVAGVPAALLAVLLLPGGWRWLPALPYLLYVLANLSSSAVIAARCGWLYMRILPAIYWVIHWGLGWGFLSELFKAVRKQPIANHAQ